MEESDSRSKLSIAPYSGAILAIVALLGVLYGAPPPLQPSRPAETALAPPPVSRLQDVAARLWEDPLAAADAHSASRCLREENHQSTALKDRIREASPSSHLTVLIVALDAAPYAESIEARLNSRYAVVSGLDVGGYIPEDSERIGYVKLQLNGDDSIIPFEWFTREDNESYKTVVLWLPDTAFASSPPLAISQLASTLSLDSRQVLRFIGPTSSTILRDLVKHLGQAPPLPNRLVLYSYAATAPDAALFDGLTDRPSSVNDFLSNHNVEMVRTGGTDDKLITALREELEHRQVTAGQDAVLLLSEWDTLYGRALPREFTDQACGKPDPKCQQAGGQRCREAEQCRGRILRRSYLRGLDGALTAGTKANKGTSGAPSTKSAERKSSAQEQSAGGMEGLAIAAGALPTPSIEELESPHGRGQLDYVRRLAEEVRELDSGLTRRGGRIKAVGVLGSDVYDKLLILQALRDELPDALFFTTDLDAQILQPSQQQWTRNLIVASFFGLTIDPDLHIQRDIPPFRDNYETAEFYSVVVALNDEGVRPFFARGDGQPLTRERLVQFVQPSVYEVGRTGGRYLPTDGQWGLRLNRRRDARLNRATVGLSLPDPQPTPTWATFVIAGVGLAMILLVAGSWSIRGLVSRPKDRILAAVAVGLVTLIGAAIVLSPPGDEPFFVTEGISMWPAIILRLITAAVGVALLVHAKRRLEENAAGISARWKLGFTYRDVKRSQSFWPGCARLSIRRWTLPPRAAVQDGAATSIRDLWQEYVERGALRCRIFRITPHVVFFIIFGVCVLATLGFPNNPARGIWSRFLSVASLVLSVPIVVCLTYFVADATRLCAAFVTQLQTRNVGWPEKFLRADDNLSMALDDERNWSRIGLVAKRTAAVGDLVVYPFIMVVGMFAARLQFFDALTIPIGLLVILGALLAHAIGCALVLRRAAEQIRAATLESLRQQLVRAQRAELGAATSPELRQSRPEQIKSLIEWVDNLAEGAFAHFSQQPVLHALLVPSGGIGLVTLLNYLARR